MKEVNIYIRGICKNFGEGSELKQGKYIALLEYQNRHKQVVGTELHTTSNRMFIKALIEGLKLLKEPCVVNVYVPTSLGFDKPNKSPNKDLLNEVLEIVKDNSHSFNRIISHKHQNYLVEELRKIDYK